MKKLAKRLAALALAAATLIVPAGAVTPDGQSETWFDGVWALIESFGLNAENNPYVLQNYINLYLQEHPEEMYNVLNDILSLLDTHSMYLSSEEYAQGFPTLESFVGIGVSMQQTADGVQIAEVMRYSSAEEAGLQAGDFIVAVDGTDTTAMTNADVAELLRGAEGTDVSITVRRGGSELTVTCTRRPVSQVYVSSQTMADGVEYIKVSAMGSENDWNAFSEIWEGLDEKNTRAVILDLRGNGGGVIDVALKMADAMTEDEGVYLAGIRWREDMGGLEPHYSTGAGLPLNEIVVLVDGGTASAAELLAGSLQDTGTATLVGETTYGKGQGQYHIDLINGDKLVITTLELQLPLQGGYEGVGLTPDVTLTNREVTVDQESLTPLDTDETLRYGEQSDNVYAMAERLALFGLIGAPTNTFDSSVLDAVQAFRESCGMEPGLYASPDLLQALEAAVQAVDGQTYVLDDQLQTALEICKLAAAEPQQYTALPDGSWKKN